MIRLAPPFSSQKVTRVRASSLSLVYCWGAEGSRAEHVHSCPALVSPLAAPS